MKRVLAAALPPAAASAGHWPAIAAAPATLDARLDAFAAAIGRPLPLEVRLVVELAERFGARVCLARGEPDAADPTGDGPRVEVTRVCADALGTAEMAEVMRRVLLAAEFRPACADDDGPPGRAPTTWRWSPGAR